MKNDIETALLINRLVLAGASDKKVVKINIYKPRGPLPGDVLEFNKENASKMINMGYKIAQEDYK